MTVLRGDRCIVRPWKLSDALVLPALANDADVVRYLPPRFPHPYRLHDAQEWVRAHQDVEPAVTFAIERDDALVGSIGMYLGDPDSGRAGVAAVGYWIGKRYWGQGIATEAVALVAEYAFAQLGVRRLWANVMAANHVSAKVLEKNGFVHEATLRDAFVGRDGNVGDELIYVRFAPSEAMPKNG